MTDPSKRGRQSRRKGAAFERRIASTLRDLGIDATRTLQSRGGGREGADVAVEGLHIECKTGKAPNVWGALAQAQRDSSGTGRLPIVIAHREAPAFEPATEVLVMPLADGLQMLAAWVKR